MWTEGVRRPAMYVAPSSLFQRLGGPSAAWKRLRESSSCVCVCVCVFSLWFVEVVLGFVGPVTPLLAPHPE